MTKKNFNLTEFVVVLVILSIILAIVLLLVSALPSAREPANRARCLNGIKSLGTAIALYSSESSFGVMPKRGPKADLMASTLISAPKVFVCPSSSAEMTYPGTITRGGITHGKGEVYSCYKRSGQAWEPEKNWNEGWAVKYDPNVVIMGDGVLNHGGEAAVFLFKDGHGYIHRFSKDFTTENFANSYVDNVKGTFSKQDRMYKYDENFDDKIHDGTWPKFETNTMLLFSEEDGADSPTLKDASPF